jgi:hypothetical protein
LKILAPKGGRDDYLGGSFCGKMWKRERGKKNVKDKGRSERKAYNNANGWTLMPRQVPEQ